MLLTIITIVHLFTCAFLIAIVLLQQGKGADMGATFGGGSNTLFGAGGADNLLTRVTTITAFVFMCTSVYLSSSMKPSVSRAGNLLQSAPAQSAPAPIPLEVPAKAPDAVPPAEPAAAPVQESQAPATAPAAPAAAPAAPAAKP